jgi:DNA-binding transcriptional regulator of glucitol operon
VLAPKWWLLHLFVVAAVLVMLRLGEWQWHRANSATGGLQNYAYALQWPVFAGFAVFLWVRTLVEESRRTEDSPPPGGRAAPEAPIHRRRGVVVGVSAPAPAVDADEDPELAAWNARLAALGAAHDRAQRRRAETVSRPGAGTER